MRPIMPMPVACCRDLVLTWNSESLQAGACATLAKMHLLVPDSAIVIFLEDSTMRIFNWLLPLTLTVFLGGVVLAQQPAKPAAPAPAPKAAEAKKRLPERKRGK